jgi:hypothetical protein
VSPCLAPRVTHGGAHGTKGVAPTPRDMPERKRLDPNRRRGPQVDSARVALEVLRMRCGSWRKVSLAMRFAGTRINRMSSGARRPTMVFAVSLARAFGVPVEKTTSGRYMPREACPYCG